MMVIPGRTKIVDEFCNKKNISKIIEQILFENLYNWNNLFGVYWEYRKIEKGKRI